MKIISVFNNKGGVGKTTLLFHTAYALAEAGKKVLMVDLDPQCNLTLYGYSEDQIESLWKEEDAYIEDYLNADRDSDSWGQTISTTRSIHFLLKPTEDGTDELKTLPPPKNMAKGLDLIPGRLSLPMFEEKISKRWSDVYTGDPQALRTIARIRNVCSEYAEKFKYDYIFLDTSPSLGSLNKIAICTSDGFFIPCMPDLFSLYGIRNIATFLELWKKEFDSISKLLPDNRRRLFPVRFVGFLGYTLYNAKKNSKKTNKYHIAKVHFDYSIQIANIVVQKMAKNIVAHLTDAQVKTPIGGMSVMHSHVTMAIMAQKYKKPIWLVPTVKKIIEEDKPSINPNREDYIATKDKYIKFSNYLVERISLLK